MRPELTSRYFEAAGNSRVGTEHWSGPVIIGPEATYILQERRSQLYRRFALVGELLHWLTERALPRRELMGQPYSELPASVRTHRDWPVSKLTSCPIVMIPCDQVETIYHKRGYLEVRLTFAGIAVSISHGRLNAKHIREFLWSAGWPMVWDDDRLNLPVNTSLPGLLQERARLFRMPPVALRFISIGALVAIVPFFIYYVPQVNEVLAGAVACTGLVVGLFLILFGGVALSRGV
jgi:hypothetical protein